jgi:hypothetical protein
MNVIITPAFLTIKYMVSGLKCLFKKFQDPDFRAGDARFHTGDAGFRAGDAGFHAGDARFHEIGRASCRERVCQYV